MKLDKTWLRVVHAAQSLTEHAPLGHKNDHGRGEYDRALVELTCDTVGAGPDHERDVVSLLITGRPYDHRAGI